MKTNKTFVAASSALISIILASCSHPVSFRTGDRYFVRNDVDSVPLVMRSAAERDSALGMAVTMSAAPTDVDFSTEAIVNIALPETDRPTVIDVKGVSIGADGIMLVTYSATSAPSASYSIRPYAMVIVKTADLAKAKEVRLERVGE